MEKKTRNKKEWKERGESASFHRLSSPPSAIADGNVQPQPPYPNDEKRQRHRNSPINPKSAGDLHRLGLKIEHGGAEKGGDESTGEEDGRENGLTEMSLMIRL